MSVSTPPPRRRMASVAASKNPGRCVSPTVASSTPQRHHHAFLRRRSQLPRSRDVDPASGPPAGGENNLANGRRNQRSAFERRTIAAMPPQISSTPMKERKTPGGASSCQAGTPTPSLRRGLVKPLGEHNRSRSFSPSVSSLNIKEHHTPARNQKGMHSTAHSASRSAASTVASSGVDLSRRFADTIHGSCTTLRTPRGSPSITRTPEGCSSSLSRKGSGASFKSRFRGGVSGTASPSEIRNGDHADGMVSPFPWRTPDGSSQRLNWDDKVKPVAEFHRSRSFSPAVSSLGVKENRTPARNSNPFHISREPVSKGSFTPGEEQPFKSPELPRRAPAAQDTGPSPQQTPSPQPTSSPEFLKRGSVPPSSGGCFGAGPLMGPEGMRSVKDRRKCKPRGILTIEGEFLFSSGSADFEELHFEETISIPALASVEWMVAEGDDVPESSDTDTVSPGSFLEDDSENVSGFGSLFQEASFASYLDDAAGGPGYRTVLQEPSSVSYYQ